MSQEEMNKLQLQLEEKNKTILMLEAKLQRQAHTITVQQNSLEQKNKELDALHKVWCNGGCKSGTHRYTNEPMTQEIIDLAVANTNRLVEWWENYNARQTMK